MEFGGGGLLFPSAPRSALPLLSRARLLASSLCTAVLSKAGRLLAGSIAAAASAASAIITPPRVSGRVAPPALRLPPPDRAGTRGWTAGGRGVPFRGFVLG